MSRAVAIMQPYFFPYIGYFQLMVAADLFVVHDDVQYIKQGWINRNRLLRNGITRWLTIPVVNESHNQVISEKRIESPAKHLPKAFNRICEYYRGAPFFRQTAELLEPLFYADVERISDFNLKSLRAVGDALGIGTPLVLSSSRQYGHDISGEARIIRICKDEGAARYINPIRAREIGLYDANHFASENLTLYFLKTFDDLIYSQKAEVFIPHLSIIDVMMFTPLERIREFLRMYSLEK